VQITQVSISNNLTPKQRDEIKKMLADAKKEHAENSSEDEGNFWFLVVGHGHWSQEASNQNKKTELSCLFLTAQSIVNKFDMFQATVSVLNINQKIPLI